MVFRSKMDSSYIKIFVWLFIVVTAVMWIAPLLDTNLSIFDWILLSVIYGVTIGFLIWTVLDIKYEFKDDYLFVKGGPFRSKIKYSDITKVAKASELLTGYRLVNSKNAIEIFYTTSIMGSVKISPYRQEEFIEELIKRCPNIENKLSLM